MRGTTPSPDAERCCEVIYEPSPEPGRLQVGVTYTVWIPRGGALRGAVVHQHGCGVGACQAGATAAFDLHWQALARKWGCALLGPSYHQAEEQDCQVWSDPRRGSEETFLRALGDLGAQSGHPELERVPWCLWGHSGGAHWVNVMALRHPERIAALWLRSGGAFRWQDPSAAAGIPTAVYGIPAMCNAGVKERDDAHFRRAWNATLQTFQVYRAHGAPIGFAPDPRSGHECGNSRYLAIPFLDACLAMRLPDPGHEGGALRPVRGDDAWLAAPLSTEAVPAASYRGCASEAVWLPNATVARAWVEYVCDAEVSDRTPPPAPSSVRASGRGEGGTEIAWECEADLESGVGAFVVERDGREIARVPEEPDGAWGRPLFQRMSYHDTPEKPLPEMRFVDPAPLPGTRHEYRVISVNSVGLRSEAVVARQ